jgi:fructokinase
MDHAEPLVAGVELGGTKSVALIARGTTIIEQARFPTADPAATLDAIGDTLTRWRAAEPFEAIGIGSFGPIGLDPARADFGTITTTPKPSWAGTDVRGYFARRFEAPIGFDTDVAGAALAEGRWGAAIGCGVHVYLTIGTGIGGGVVVNGRPVHGLIHPEIGHIRTRRAAGDGFPGICPYHDDCLEGLASGPAIAARAGVPAGEIGADDPLWRPVAATLSELMAMLILTLSPERILIGGGVGMGQPQLLPMIRAGTAEILGGYVAGVTTGRLEEMIRAPGLGELAGPLGAVALGYESLRP